MKRMNVCMIGASLGLALLCCGGCKSSPAVATSPESAETKIARNYVTGFFAGDTTALDGLEDRIMTRGMTKEKVTDTLQKLNGFHGAFKSQGVSRTARIAGHSVVYIPCSFEHGALDAKVILDNHKKVAGFFFVAPGGQ